MNLAVAFTVTDRPEYFSDVLDSWAAVRGVENVRMSFNIEPTPVAHRNLGLIYKKLPHVKNVEFFHNSERLGVLKNPRQSLERAFFDRDYVILAEDDLVVSDDILDYHTWAMHQYATDRDIAMVCSYSPFLAEDSMAPCVMRVPNFASVWIWGTWKDRWEEYINPTWDTDYSTETPEAPGGWDWNLNKRVLPWLGKHSIQPIISRVRNIGVNGTHGNGTIVPSPTFTPGRSAEQYVELGA